MCHVHRPAGDTGQGHPCSLLLWVKKPGQDMVILGQRCLGPLGLDMVATLGCGSQRDLESEASSDWPQLECTLQVHGLVLKRRGWTSGQS